MPTTQAPALALKARVFRGFSDPSRLAILEALRDGPRTVSELVGATGLSQSNASNHLACLLGCGLVARQQHGRHAVYTLRGDRVRALLSGADDLLADAARALYECTCREGCGLHPLPSSE